MAEVKFTADEKTMLMEAVKAMISSVARAAARNKRPMFAQVYAKDLELWHALNGKVQSL